MEMKSLNFRRQCIRKLTPDYAKPRSRRARIINCVSLLRGMLRIDAHANADAVLLSFLLSAGISALGVLPFQTNLIASLAPGLMVRDMERQGLWKTLASLAIVTGLLALVMLWMGWL